MTPTENPATGLGQSPASAPRRDLSSILGPRPRTGQAPPDEPAPTAKQATRAGANTSSEETKPAAKTREKSGTMTPSATPTPAPEPAAASSPEKEAPQASAASDAHLKVDRVVYLPDDITVRLAADCARQRLTRTEMVLAALEATHQDLPDLVEASMAPKVTHGALFDVVTPATRRDQPAKRQVFITPTRQQLAIIDGLRENAGARDRSHLIMVALDAHLT